MKNVLFNLKVSTILLVVLMLLFWVNPVLSADIIYRTSEGKETIYAKDVIVIKHGELEIKYRYLAGNIIKTSSCTWQKEKGESCRVVKSSLEEIQSIIERWKGLGNTVEITDVTGFKTTIHNFYLDFRAPEGKMLLIMGFWQSERTWIRLKRGESKIKIDFQDIQKMSIDGDNITITLLGGDEISGILDYERLDSGEPLRAVLAGMEYFGKEGMLDFSINFRQVKSIVFKRPQK